MNMKQIETRSTSSVTAVVSPVVLRSSERRRLVFLPMLVSNPNDRRHCVKGTFIYQKKLQSQEWAPIAETPLSSLKAGEGFQLELHSHELFKLIGDLAPLYSLFKQHGVQPGRKQWVRLQATLAAFLALGEGDLTTFLNSHREGATESLVRILKWLSTAPRGGEFTSKLTQLDPKQLPELNALLGLAAVKSALQYWKMNQTNSDEEFWQRALAERAFVLSQVFAYPAVVIGKKMYVGGKQISNKGGNVVDFLARVKATGSVVLIEIKTPQTKLLGPQYRNEAFPLSTDLSGAIAQALKYRQSLMREFDHLVRRDSGLLLGEPRCLVVAGNVASQLTTSAMRESFELHRDRLQGVTILGYDELFDRLECTISLLEGTDSPSNEEPEEAPPF
jgi:hypothetical protein